MIPLNERSFMAELGGSPIFRPQLRGVFQHDGWDFVTNGHAMLRVRGESPPPAEPRDAPPPIGPVIAQPRPHVRTTDMSSLCDWASLFGPLWRHCPYCESPGDIWETSRIQLGGVEINRCLLWHYLKPLPRVGSLRVSWGDPKHALLVAHEDWEIYVMPLGEPDEKYTRPFSFDPASDGLRGSR